MLWILFLLMVDCDCSMAYTDFIFELEFLVFKDYKIFLY
jgi:hypothetical protein